VNTLSGPTDDVESSISRTEGRAGRVGRRGGRGGGGRFVAGSAPRETVAVVRPLVAASVGRAEKFRLEVDVDASDAAEASR
jgi:hypothetical protein